MRCFELTRHQIRSKTFLRLITGNRIRKCATKNERTNERARERESRGWASRLRAGHGLVKITSRFICSRSREFSTEILSNWYTHVHTHRRMNGNRFLHRLRDRFLQLRFLRTPEKVGARGKFSSVDPTFSLLFLTFIVGASTSDRRVLAGQWCNRYSVKLSRDIPLSR